MKLVHINLNEGILVDAINCTEWVIESPEYFSEYVMELAGQVEGKEGRFVLSDNEKEVDISKLNNIQQEMYNKAVSLSDEIDKERGVGSGR